MKAEASQPSRGPGSYASARILLLSDGYSTAGVPAPVAIAAAAEQGVAVYTVGIGTVAGRIQPDMGAGTAAGFDEDTLLAMATKTKGRYWNGARVTDRAQLVQSIEAALRYEPQAAEVGSYFSGLGALLLLAAAVGSLASGPRVRR
jgi:Ca-activated chloride channel family protein